MNHTNIKCFIIILLVDFLVQKNVSAYFTERQMKCFNSIRKYYGIKTDIIPTELGLAKYGFLHFRYHYETTNQIKVVPPKNSDNREEKLSPCKFRRVENLNDKKLEKGSSSRLSSAIKGRTPIGVAIQGKTPIGIVIQEKIPSGGSSLGETSGGADSVGWNSRVVGQQEDPWEDDDVKEYYEEFIPHLTPHSNVKTPAIFCGNHNDHEKCTNDIKRFFDLNPQEKTPFPKFIVQKIYKYYVIDELEKGSHEEQYMQHVSSHFKLEKVNNKKMKHPVDFCKKKYP